MYYFIRNIIEQKIMKFMCFFQVDDLQKGEGVGEMVEESFLFRELQMKVFFFCYDGFSIEVIVYCIDMFGGIEFVGLLFLVLGIMGQREELELWQKWKLALF